MVRCLHRSCVHASFFSQRAFASSGAPALTLAEKRRREGGGREREREGEREGEGEGEVVQGPLSLWRVNNASGTFVASVSAQFLQVGLLLCLFISLCTYRYVDICLSFFLYPSITHLDWIVFCLKHFLSLRF